MDRYGLLRFAHLIGLMLISAGLIGVFVADMRSRQVRDVRLFAQAVTFIAVFYDGLVVPGAILLLASGTWLIAEYHGGWSFIGTRKLCMMSRKTKRLSTEREYSVSHPAKNSPAYCPPQVRQTKRPKRTASVT